MLTVNVHGFYPQSGHDPHDVDEVVAPGFHLETLGDKTIWMSVHDDTGRRVTFFIGQENGRLMVRVQDDDRTADEKSKDRNAPAGGQWGAWHPMYDGSK